MSPGLPPVSPTPTSAAQGGAPATLPTGYQAWAANVGELCGLIEALRPLGAALGVPDPTGTEWYGQLFGKLRPQVTREAVLVAAVCGGTNTGKSLLTNVLVGSPITQSVPEAARTRCPAARWS